VAEPVATAIRVVVAGDDFVVREGLGSLLSDTGGLEVTARVRSYDELLDATERTHPDVVVVHLQSGRHGSGAAREAGRRLRSEHPDVGIVVLALESDQLALELLRHGPGGMVFLLVDHIADLDVLTTAIHQAHRGQVTVDPAVIDALAQRREGAGLDRLTGRELDVLREMAKGYGNKAVAENLSISVKAVERHVTGIFRKLRQTDDERFDGRVAAVLAYRQAFGD
jgi:DNA-binding NarL/FixJ family response regulator